MYTYSLCAEIAESTNSRDGGHATIDYNLHGLLMLLNLQFLVLHVASYINWLSSYKWRDAKWYH